MKKWGRTHWDAESGVWVRPRLPDPEHNLVNDQGLSVPEDMARVGRTYWDRGQQRWTTPPGGLMVAGKSRYDPEVQKMLASGVNFDSVLL
jgi:hypothetical protein